MLRSVGQELGGIPWGATEEATVDREAQTCAPEAPAGVAQPKGEASRAAKESGVGAPGMHCRGGISERRGIPIWLSRYRWARTRWNASEVTRNAARTATYAWLPLSKRGLKQLKQGLDAMGLADASHYCEPLVKALFGARGRSFT